MFPDTWHLAKLGHDDEAAIDDRVANEQSVSDTHLFDGQIEQLKEGEGIGGRALTVSYGLWALHLLSATPDELNAARETVLAAQRPDGGWSQLDDMESDAYATGHTLYMLGLVGMPAADPAYQRGVAYLLKTQRDDGSWFVKSRSKPIQVYFDNGDPHGKDQFISTPATCWALAALARGCEPPKPQAAD